MYSQCIVVRVSKWRVLTHSQPVISTVTNEILLLGCSLSQLDELDVMS